MHGCISLCCGSTVAAYVVQVRLLRPTGLLVVRTVALSAPLALASALAARTDGCAGGKSVQRPVYDDYVLWVY